MGCCSGCDTGTGCQTGCSGTGCGPATGCATCSEPPQPAQLFVPNFFPATGCADGSCKLPPATGRMNAAQWLGAFANAARHLPPPPAPITPAGFWADVQAPGHHGVNLRADASLQAATLGAIPNGTRVWVSQITPDAWCHVAIPSMAGKTGYVRAIGPASEPYLTRVS